MSGKLQFREKLSGILKLGNENQNVLNTEDVEKYFEDDSLSQEQMELVYDYLLSQKITVTGYVKRGGTVRAVSEETAQNVRQSGWDTEYLGEYLKEVAAMMPQNSREEKMKYFFPKVAEIAKEFIREDFLIEDLIQEGNVGLMLALEEGLEEEAAVLAGVRRSIQSMLEEQDEQKRKDREMVEKVQFLDESIRNLTEDLNRKPTLEELAAYIEMTEEEVNDILRLMGEEE